MYIIKSLIVLSYLKPKKLAEIKKIKKFNFGAAVSQNYASGNVKYEWFHKSQVKNDPKKIFYFFLFFSWSFYPGHAHIYAYIIIKNRWYI